MYCSSRCFIYIYIWEFQAETLHVCPKHGLGTPTKLQLEILTIIVVSVIASFRNIFLESSQNISETTPELDQHWFQLQFNCNPKSFVVINVQTVYVMALLPDTQNCGLRMRRECRERFPATEYKVTPASKPPCLMVHGNVFLCLLHTVDVMNRYVWFGN